MDCDICLIEWDSALHIPRLLPCGHTLCEVCLKGLLNISKTKEKEFTCPICNAKHKEITSEEDIKKLIKNINLLRIAEKFENRRSTISKMSVGGESNKNRNNNISQPSNNVFLNDLRSENFQEQLCKKHNQVLYLYASGTNMSLCDQCVKETNLKAYPLPNLVKDFKRKIDSTKVKIGLVEAEIERLKDFFSSYETEFYNENKKKLDNLFDYLSKILFYNYNASLHILNQCKSEQKAEIDSKLNELNSLQNEIKGFNDELNEYSNNSDKDILEKLKKLNKIYMKLNNYINYDLPINLLTMKIGIKEETKNELFYLIQDSYFVDAEFANIKGEIPTIQHILQKDKYWTCICGETSNSISIIRCNNCHLLRKLETLQHVYTNAGSSTNSEINTIIFRRKEECKIFSEISNLKSNNQKGYVVDSEWFIHWKCFVTNDLTEKSLPNTKKRLSTNNSIGVLPPGPITNNNLFDKTVKDFNLETLRKGLKKNQDYVTLSKDLWAFLLENYGGGIEIELDSNNDIYSKPTIRMVAEKFMNTLYKRRGEDNSELSYSNLDDDDKREGNYMEEDDENLPKNNIIVKVAKKNNISNKDENAMSDKLKKLLSNIK